MPDFPTTLIGWADEMLRSAAVCEEAGAPQSLVDGNRSLAELLRSTDAEALRLRKRVEVLERVRFAAQCVPLAFMHAEYCDRVTAGSLVCTCGHASLKEALDAAKETNDG